MNLLKVTTCLALLLFLLSIESSSQNKGKFYDFKWKECEPNIAKFYSQTTKTDSGYYRKDFFIKEKHLQMTGNYLDSLCKIKNGRFTFYHANGTLKSLRKYKENKEEGLFMSFYNNGFMRDSVVFSNGKKIGKILSWHINGYQRDSIFLNKDRSGVRVSWFNNGIPSVAGRYSADMKQHGKWKYFHRNGKVSSIEIYDKSKLISKQYFTESGKFQSDTTNTDRKAQFKKGTKAWQKYISNHIYFPHGYKIVNADVAKVLVTFTVNAEGEIENVFTSTPLDKIFDSIALKAIKKSPEWLPAIEHNRKVKSTLNMVINFRNHI